MISEKQNRDKPDTEKQPRNYFSAVGVGAETVFVKAVQVAEWIESKEQKLQIIDCRMEEKSYQNGHVPGGYLF